MNAGGARRELELRIGVLPAALLLSWLIVKSSLGHWLIRIFFTRLVHETGHAVTAWLCGFTAFPGLWFTPVSSSRSPSLSILLAGALGYGVYRSWNSQRRPLACVGVALLGFQLVGTLVLRLEQARALFFFGGDAGCLVLGSLLMATFYLGEDSALYQGLRWGFVAMGAASFMDVFAQWWAARTDVDSIPFGEMEGVGLSDPSQLTEVYGWSVTQLVQRYTGLGCACLVALGVLYVVGLLQARARLHA